MDSKTELNAIQIVRNVLDNNGIVRHCMNCGDNIKEGNKILCGLNKEAGQPPAKVLIYGCGKWYQEIPF